MDAHRATTAEHDEEALNSASSADYPCQSDKEDHAKDVLDTWQVNAYERTHPRSTSRWCRPAVRIGRSWDGVAVIGQIVEQRRNPRPILHLLLRIQIGSRLSRYRIPRPSSPTKSSISNSIGH